MSSKVKVGKPRPVEFLRGRGAKIMHMSAHRWAYNFEQVPEGQTHWLVADEDVVVWSGRWDTSSRSFRDCDGILPDKRPARQPDRPTKGHDVKVTLSEVQLASDEWRAFRQWMADSSGRTRTIGGETFMPGHKVPRRSHELTTTILW